MPSKGPIEGFDPTYSWINSISSDEDDNTRDELSYADAPTTDDDEDSLICEININAYNYRLRKAKVDRDAVLGKIDASLA